MKLVVRLLGAVLGLVLLAAVGGYAYIMLALPRVSPPGSEKVNSTPARIARGDYLAHHVAVCLDCHSDHDWNKVNLPMVAGTEGQGGFHFNHDLDFPGDVVAPNITPHNLGRYSDGELIRVLRTGVTKEGRPLFPVMPYLHFAGASQEDLYSLIAYVRALKPIGADHPATRLDFPMNLITRTMQKDAGPYPAAPAPGDSVAYGKYLANLANCVECHTPINGQHEPIAGREFAGGLVFSVKAWGRVTSSNLTPDMQTGLGQWTREQFIQRFKAQGTPEALNIPWKPGDFNTPMPWSYFAGMSDSDLGAIYAYLRTLPPVRNAVVKFVPAHKAS